MIIYKITNTKNGKAYIGCTCRSLRSRMSGHWSAARRGKDTLIAQAIREFEPDSFEVEVIGRAGSSEEMYLMETEAIKSQNTCYPNGYNSSPWSGIWAPRNVDRIRESISQAHKGKTLSEEHKQKLSDACKGQAPWNLGLKTGKPAWNTGMKMSDEYRVKLVAAHAKHKSPNAREVIFLGITYPSVTEAGRANSIPRGEMRRLLKTGHAQYVDAPDGGYVEDNAAARRWAKVLNCPKCGGEYSKFKSGLRYCKPCRNEKMMVAQRLRRAAKKNPAPIVPDGAVDANPPTGEPEKENSQ